MRSWNIVLCIVVASGCKTTGTTTSSIGVQKTEVGASSLTSGPLYRACTRSDLLINDTDPLAGVYEGLWLDGAKDGLQHAIVVRQVEETVADVTYVHGTYAPWDISAPGCTQARATLKEGIRGAKTLTLDIFNARAVYEIQKNGFVAGRFTTATGVTRGSFNKI